MRLPEAPLGICICLQQETWIKCGFDPTGSGEGGGQQTGRAAWQQHLMWVPFVGLSRRRRNAFLQADGGTFLISPWWQSERALSLSPRWIGKGLRPCRRLLGTLIKLSKEQETGGERDGPPPAVWFFHTSPTFSAISPPAEYGRPAPLNAVPSVTFPFFSLAHSSSFLAFPLTFNLLLEGGKLLCDAWKSKGCTAGRQTLLSY